MKTLVTGGTGFIGSPVVDGLLDGGHTVRLFSRRPLLPPSLRGRDIEVVQGRLEDAPSLVKAMEGMEVFYHIGEIKNVSAAAAGKNIALMEQIVANLAGNGIQRFVFISSITVAGIPAAVPALEETAPATALHDHYTDYKRRCEEIIREKVTDSTYAIIRPAPVYGPGSRYLGKLITAVRLFGPTGLPFIGSAKNRAPLIHVKDLAGAIVRAGLQQEASGETFNLIDGADHTWLDFLAAIGKAVHKNVRIIAVPPLLLKFAALPFDLFSGFLGIRLDPATYLDYFSADLLFDNAKARRLLAWEPAYTLAEGIEDMVSSYTSR